MLGDGYTLCRRCSVEPVFAPQAILAPCPPELADLRYPERLLIARAQISQIMFELPAGRMIGQHGRLYAVPLEVPHAVSLFERGPRRR